MRRSRALTERRLDPLQFRGANVAPGWRPGILPRAKAGALAALRGKRNAVRDRPAPSQTAKAGRLGRIDDLDALFIHTDEKLSCRIRDLRRTRLHKYVVVCAKR